MADQPHRPVEPHHERVAQGVRFNVETVDALGPALAPLDHGITAADAAQVFYNEFTLPIRVESQSWTRERVVHNGGLVDMALLAFAKHYPLTLRPDDIWVLLTFALAQHVDRNAEALRSKFVTHEGKRMLVVQIDDFVVGQMEPESWETRVFADFSKQIREHVGADIHATIAAGFSTTTPSTKAAHEITLMATVKHYFSYACMTMCGIPWIELQGTEADWVALRARAAQMGELMVPAFRDIWLPVLLPVLDEFVAAYQGRVNHRFWQSMVKRIHHGAGSGSSTTINGWINVLYPYLAERQNYYLKPWQELEQANGPDPSDFPRLLSSAPVEWHYFGTTFPMHVHAGMLGTVQDPETLALRPRIGWALTHDPPMEPAKRKTALEQEIEVLKVGGGDSDYKARYVMDRIEKELASIRAGTWKPSKQNDW